MRRLPLSPDERRAKEAAKKRAYRARKAKEAVVTAHIDHSIGIAPAPTAPLPDISDKDLATAYAERMRRVIATLGDDALLIKDFQPAIANALRAQKVLDEREKVKAKNGQTLELVAGIRAILLGRVPGEPPKQLEDGLTIEGEFVEAN